jgi:hypothetical protein
VSSGGSCVGETDRQGEFAHKAVCVSVSSPDRMLAGHRAPVAPEGRHELGQEACLGDMHR